MSYDWSSPYNTQYIDTSLADSAAKNKYYNALASGSTAADALNQAKFEWQKTLDTANQSGMWNGQWSFPSNKYFTDTFGAWMPGGPTEGQQTMAKQQQDYAQAAGWSGMFGQYYAPGTTPGQGTQTLGAQTAAQQNAAAVAGLTGYYNAPGGTGQGTQTLAGQQQQWNQGFQQQQFAAQQQQLQQQNAQEYLKMLSSLRGPADWAKYQQVLGATPGGMRDLYAAAMGQYTPGGGATTGVQPQAVNLNTMQQQIAGQGGYYQAPGEFPGWQQQAQGGGYQPGPYRAPTIQSTWTGANPQGPAPAYETQFQPMHEQQIQNYNQQMANQMQQARAGNGQVWGSGIGVGAQQPTPAQQAQGLGGGTNTFGAQDSQYKLPAPNQVAAQSWNNLAPSQQQMMLGEWESQGYDKNDALALYNQSLPKYGAAQAGAGTYRLR